MATKTVATTAASLAQPDADQGASGAVDLTSTPMLGTQIAVRIAAGVVLFNNETGTLFAEGVDTTQLVTVTTLRRLQDGDFQRVG